MTDAARIEGDEIVIRVKIKDLSGAAWQGLEFAGYEDGDEMDFNQLAEDITRRLNDEAEDGTTLVHKALDQAVIEGFENADAAFAYLEDNN